MRFVDLRLCSSPTVTRATYEYDTGLLNGYQTARSKKELSRFPVSNCQERGKEEVREEVRKGGEERGETRAGRRGFINFISSYPFWSNAASKKICRQHCHPPSHLPPSLPSSLPSTLPPSPLSPSPFPLPPPSLPSPHSPQVMETGCDDSDCEVFEGSSFMNTLSQSNHHNNQSDHNDNQSDHHDDQMGSSSSSRKSSFDITEEKIESPKAKTIVEWRPETRRKPGLPNGATSSDVRSVTVTIDPPSEEGPCSNPSSPQASCTVR